MTIHDTLRELKAILASLDKMLDDANYSAYKFNKEHSPNITPEQWGWIFPDAKELEERYQKEATK